MKRRRFLTCLVIVALFLTASIAYAAYDRTYNANSYHIYSTLRTKKTSKGYMTMIMTYAAGQATMLQPLSIPTHGLQAIRGQLKRHGVLMERLLRPNSNLDLAQLMQSIS